MESQQQDPDGARELRHHGGNINAARRLFRDAPEPWIDLSTGLNPVPYPVRDLPPSAWSRLPEPSDLAALEQAARIAYGATSAAGIVAAPGTQALIQWLPRLFQARRVGVLGFTYQEHAACWRDAGAEISTVHAVPELAAFDAGIVVNPNNPDGRTVAPAELVEIAAMLARRGGRLIVDEAFMDLEAPAASMVPRIPAPGAVVLRSFGKTYGLAGLRLGFAVGSEGDCALLRQAVGPWAVSGPALRVGRQALADEAWRAQAAARLHGEAERLDRLLRRTGFQVDGGTLLFRLARHPEAQAAFDHLCQAGILTRPFQAKPDWLRFGIPNGSEEWPRLEAALHAFAAATGP